MTPGASTQPTRLQKEGNQNLKITWEDGHAGTYGFRYLRQNCQCAMCVDEWTGKDILEKEKVSQSLEGVHVELVGQYAVRIDFSDGHNTGLFTFKHLRKICPCEACKVQ